MSHYIAYIIIIGYIIKAISASLITVLRLPLQHRLSQWLPRLRKRDLRMFGKFTVNFSVFDLTVAFQDVNENANWNQCLDVNGASLARCIYNCNDNGDCEDECVSQFKGRTQDCPCEVSRVIFCSFVISHTVLLIPYKSNNSNSMSLF